MDVYDVNCLRNDYHFLEDALQCKQGAKRTLNSLLNVEDIDAAVDKRSKQRKKGKQLWKTLSLESIQENNVESAKSISLGIMYQNIQDYPLDLQLLVNAVWCVY